MGISYSPVALNTNYIEIALKFMPPVQISSELQTHRSNSLPCIST